MAADDIPSWVNRAGQAAVAAVLVIAALDLWGWASGNLTFTRLAPDWPPMVPWTAGWLTALGAAILLRSRPRSPVQVRSGRGVAAAVAVSAAVVVIEHLTGRPSGAWDQLWFGETVRITDFSGSPGRPAYQTAISTTLLAAAVALAPNGRRWVRVTRLGLLAMSAVMPWAVVLGYIFTSTAAIRSGPFTGMSVLAGASLLLLLAAFVATQPGEQPLAWLLATRNPTIPVRLLVVVGGYPLLIGLTRRVLLAGGLDPEVVPVYATVVGTLATGTLVLFLSRREEALLEASESDRALLRATSDNAAVGMCLIDPQGNFVDVNAALCEFFGYDAETLKTKTWQELTAPAFLEADLSKVGDVLAGRLDSYRMLKQYIHADGHPIWGDLSVSCIRDRHGRVEHFVSQIIDVTATVTANELNLALNQRLTDELRSAAGYIATIMPKGIEGRVNVSSQYLPSLEVGGDCYDYAWIDDEHLMVYLIDVSGHGIEPALLAVSLQNILRSGTFTTETLLNPRAVLAALNRRFQMEQQHDHFFTIWYGVYESRTRTMSYANAGAPPAYAFEPADDGVSTRELATTSRPVGLFEDTEFSARAYYVPPGCRILIYSDGASELALPSGGKLSQEGFRRLVTRVAQAPNWSLDALVDRLRTVAPGGDFRDDCSLILLAFD